MAQDKYVAPLRYDAEGRPIATGGTFVNPRPDQREAILAATGDSQITEAREGLLGEAAELQEQHGLAPAPSLLADVTLEEGEVFDANSVLDGAMNVAVAHANVRAAEAVRTASMTREQRLGREVALAIEQRVSEREAEIEAERQDLPPELREQYEAGPAETAALETWLEDDGDEQDRDPEEADYDWDDGEAA